MYLLLAIFLWVNPWLVQQQEVNDIESQIRIAKKPISTDLLLTRGLVEKSDKTLIDRYGLILTARAKKSPDDYYLNMAAHRLMTDAYIRTGKLPQALFHIHKAVDYAKKGNDKQWTISNLITLAAIEQSSARLERAFSTSLEALKIAEEDTNGYTLKGVYGQHANVLYGLQNMPAARKYLLLSLDAAQAGQPDTQAYVDIYNNIALSYQFEKDYVKALAYFQEALKYGKHIQKHRFIIGVIHGNIGNIYYLLGKYQLALEEVKIDLKTSLQYGNDNSYLNAAYLLAEIYLKLGDKRNALRCYQDAEKKTASVIDPILKDNIRLLTTRADVAEQLGFSAQALTLHKKAATIMDNIQKNTADFKISNLMATYDLELKNQEILKKQSLIQAKSEALAAAEKQRLYLIISLVGLLLLGAFTLRGLSQKSQLARKLMAQKDTILAQNQVSETARVQLEKAITQRTAILSIVSHDLKAPISRVQGLLELTKLDPDNHAQYSQMIEVSIQDANALVKNLLDDAALEEGSRTVKAIRFDLVQLVKELIIGLGHAAEYKGINLALKTELTRFFVITDRAQLTRILENLISNAIKFSPKNTVVTLAIRPLVDYQVEISIQDQGPGIAKEEQANLFQPFYKGAAIPTGGESSTGLGLSIVYRLTQLLQGSVKLYSDRGIGAKFAIVLPIHLGVEDADIDEEIMAHYRLLTIDKPSNN